jgi:hypothetical protein
MMVQSGIVRLPNCIAAAMQQEDVMKSIRFALFSALIGASTLFSSAHYSPAAAGGLGLDWLSNKQYVQCLQGTNFLAKWNNGRPQSQADAAAAQERGRHYCNKQYGYE